jgi:hypothetical protein
MENVDITALINDIKPLLKYLIFLIPVCFEIAPIKVNPVSKFLNWVGHAMNKSTDEKLEFLSKKLDTVERSLKEHELDQLCWTILEFANSITQKRRNHTKDEFDHILDSISKYKDIVNEHPEFTKDKYGNISIAIDFITDLYKKCFEENNFL